MSGASDIELLAGKVAAAIPHLDATGQELGVNLIRLLALGEPVDPAILGGLVGLPEAQVVDELDRWPGVFRNEQGQVIGYAGLTVIEMGHHRIHVNGRVLSTWCAYDTLFLPELLGAKVHVTSRSPDSDQGISLTVGPDGVSDLHPDETVVSFLVPDAPFDGNVIQSFCHFVHFFPSDKEAARWTAGHERTFVLSVEDAFRLGRLTNQARFGDALAPQ